MKQILLLFMLSAAIASCGSNASLNDLSGTYENTDDDSITKIEKLNDTEYRIYLPDAKDLVTATRKGNALTATFQGIQISEEFNASFDTITNKANGKIICQSSKLKDSR